MTEASLILEPLGLGDAVPGGLLLAGGPLRFERVRLALRRGRVIERAVVDLASLPEWSRRRGVAEAAGRALATLSAPRQSFAGLSLAQPLIMGIVNVTPDSFSDGGEAFSPDDAIARGCALRAAGADILDIGGESTRPGSDEVAPAIEAARVVPVIRALAAEGAVISIDTRHAAVMAAALDAGARIVNDVTALRGDPASLPFVAQAGCPVILMHMQGEPKTMQAAPAYDDVVLDIHDRLADDVARCAAAGISPDRIALDPGIGFGKTVEHNLTLIRHAAAFHDLGCALLYGVSRKRFVGTLDGGADVKGRLAGSLAAGLAALDRGVQMLRVHDVAETRQARAIWRAVRFGAGG